MRITGDPLAMNFPVEFYAPGVCFFSTGSGSKSSSSSKTKWNQPFMDELENYLPSPRYSTDFEGLRIEDVPRSYSQAELRAMAANGEDPATRQQFTMGVPKFHGLEEGDFNKLESGLYERSQQNLKPTYERERERRREELSQTGLLNSPVQFSMGGALDSLERNYMDQSQKSATDASNQTILLKQSELARQMGFDMSLVALIEEMYGQRADLAARVGGVSTSRGVSSQGFSMSGETAGAAAGAAYMMCWIALAIYGPGAEFVYARLWIMEGWQGRTANATRWLYLKIGRQVAERVRCWKWLRSALKPLFDCAVHKGKVVANG